MLLRKITFLCLFCIGLAACDSSEDKAKAHYERGMELLAEGDVDRAILEFRNALENMGTMVLPRLELARLNLERGDLRLAARQYQRVAEQEPDNIEANITLAEIAFQTISWEAFDRYTEAALKLAPEDPRVRVLDVAAQYRQAVVAEDGPLQEAVVAQAEAIRQEAPDNQILRRVLIDGYIRDNNQTAALDLLDEAIASDPKNMSYYTMRAQMLATLGENEALEAELRRIVDAFPDETEPRANLLRFLIANGDIEGAEAVLRERVDTASPDDPAPVIDLVRFKLSTGETEAAIAELKAAVEKAPDSQPLRMLRASLIFENGDRETAIEEMEDIIERQTAALGNTEDSTSEELESSKVLLARMLIATDNPVGARRLVDEVLASNPNNPDALKLRAGWDIAEDRTDAAISSLRVALAEAPQDFSAMMLMADAYRRAGNAALTQEFMSLAVETSGNAPDPSLKYAQELVDEGRIEQAESILISSLRVNPGHFAILSTLGDIYLRLEDEPRLRQVIEALEDSEEERYRLRAEELKLRQLAQTDGTERALKYLETLSQENEENTGIKLALVRAKLSAGQTDVALEMVNEELRKNPQNNNFLYFKSLIQTAKGDFDAAEDTLTQVVEQEPGAVLAWSQKVKLANASAGADVAMQVLETGLQANPDAPQLLWQKASLLESKGDIDGAIAIYETMYETNSSWVLVANNLASLLATYRRDEGSLERAAVVGRRLRDTDIPAYQDTYGWILARQGKTEEALPYLEAAAAALQEDGIVQYHLGRVYADLGRRDEAIEQMRKAISMSGPLAAQKLLDEIRENLRALEATPAGE